MIALQHVGVEIENSRINKDVQEKGIFTSGEYGGRGSASHKVVELGISSEMVELDFGISPSGGSSGQCPSSDPFAC